MLTQYVPFITNPLRDVVEGGNSGVLVSAAQAYKAFH